MLLLLLVHALKNSYPNMFWIKNKFQILILCLLQFISITGFGQQNKIGGTYAADIVDFAGGRSYSTAITFKYNNDTFFYWHGAGYGEKTGKGTYKIEGNKLYLKFENTKAQKPLKSTAIVSPVPNRPISENKEISFNSFDPNGKEEYSSSVIIKTASGINDTLTIVNNPLVKTYKTIDFPLTIKGLLAACMPVNFRIDRPASYNVKVNFQPFTDEMICNGEVWVYNIIELKHDEMILKEIKDMETVSDPQKFIFISYSKGY